MWVMFNPNPDNRFVGDCAVRAVAAALDVDWETAYAMIAAKAFSFRDMPSSDAVWGSVLRQHGFKRAVVPNSCPDCYRAEDFARDNPEGIYVLGFGGHTATIRDGQLLDSWDSSKLVPQYFWYREDD